MLTVSSLTFRCLFIEYSLYLHSATLLLSIPSTMPFLATRPRARPHPPPYPQNPHHDCFPPSPPAPPTTFSLADPPTPFPAPTLPAPNSSSYRFHTSASLSNFLFCRTRHSCSRSRLSASIIEPRTMPDIWRKLVIVSMVGREVLGWRWRRRGT